MTEESSSEPLFCMAVNEHGQQKGRVNMAANAEKRQMLARIREALRNGFLQTSVGAVPLSSRERRAQEKRARRIELEIAE